MRKPSGSVLLAATWLFVSGAGLGSAQVQAPIAIITAASRLDRASLC